MMITRASFTLHMLVCLNVVSKAATLDSVLARYDQAVGGGACKAIKTLSLEGEFSNPSSTYPVVIRIVTGKAVRQDVTVDGVKFISAYKGGIAWSHDQNAEATVPGPINPQQAQSFLAEFDRVNPIGNAQGKSAKLELLGEEAVDGTAAYKLKLTWPDSPVKFLYLDAKTFLPLKERWSENIAGESADVERFFSHYIQVNGCAMAKSTLDKTNDSEFRGYEFATIKANVPIDERIFAAP